MLNSMTAGYVRQKLLTSDGVLISARRRGDGQLPGSQQAGRDVKNAASALQAAFRRFDGLPGYQSGAWCQ